jgi:hypothetical protein
VRKTPPKKNIYPCLEEEDISATLVKYMRCREASKTAANYLELEPEVITTV